LRITPLATGNRKSGQTEIPNLAASQEFRRLV